MIKAKPSRRTNIQNFRLISLISVIAFFVLVPLSNWYANNKISYNQTRLVELASGSFWSYIYSSLDYLYTFWEDPVRAATSNNGSLWAYTVFGIPISDPLGLLAELINGVKFPTKYLLGGILPFIIALLFGRFFCSWFCPMTILFYLTKKIRLLLDYLRVPLLSIQLNENTRIFIFWFGLTLSNLLGAWVWHYTLPYIVVTHELFSLIIFNSFTVGFYYLIAVLVLDIALIPGEFCRSLCPTGFFLVWLGKFRVFKLKVDKLKCPPYCIQCQRVCPVNLFPKEDKKLDSCHLCMVCSDSCPKKHIKLGVNQLYIKGNKSA